MSCAWRLAAAAHSAGAPEARCAVAGHLNSAVRDYPHRTSEAQLWRGGEATTRGALRAACLPPPLGLASSTGAGVAALPPVGPCTAAAPSMRIATCASIRSFYLPLPSHPALYSQTTLRTGRLAAEFAFVVRTVVRASFVRCSYRRSYGVRTGVRTVVRTVACTEPVAWSNNYLQIILNLTVFQRKHNEGGLGSTGRLAERREHRQVSLRCPWFVSFHPNELDPSKRLESVRLIWY